jgi:hypothetical protein
MRCPFCDREIAREPWWFPYLMWTLTMAIGIVGAITGLVFVMGRPR